MSRLSHYRLRVIALALLAGAIAMLPPGTAEAKREVTAECKWFGTAPLCDGECPKGWTLTKHSKTERRHPCLHRVNAVAATFRSTASPTTTPPMIRLRSARTYQAPFQCQQCTKWGEDCKFKGGFNTACSHYIWYNCGEAPHPSSTEPSPTGDPIIVPDGKPDPKPDCRPPHIEYDNGVCGCPAGHERRGLRGAHRPLAGC